MQARIVCLFCSLLIAFPNNSRAQELGKKLAIVVGVEQYDTKFFRPLRYADEDAIELGETLKALNFEVITMTQNESQPALQPSSAETIIKQLENACKLVEKEDTLIVFLAGHGVLFTKQPPLKDGSRESYFCPGEANPNQLSSLVPMSQVTDIISRSLAARKLLIVDACRNEAASDLFRSKSTDLGTVGLTPRTVPKGMLALFSCSEQEKSVEHPDLEHGVFTYHIIKYLRGNGEDNLYPGDQVRLLELFNFARRETDDYVFKQLQVNQSPVLKSSTEVTDWSLGKLPPRQINNSLGMKLRRISAGKFRMGNDESIAKLRQLFPYSKDDWFDDALPHRVQISKSFYIGQFEVSVGQFRKFIESTNYKTDSERDGKGWGFHRDGNFEQDAKYSWRNPGYEQTDDHPVVNVSWNDAVKFCDWLSQQEDKSYRLPTEAEWEYACRAGTATHYSFGNYPEGLAAAGNAIDKTAVTKFRHWENAIQSSDGYIAAAPIGSFKANPWELFDMHGNVCEWCHDWHAKYPENDTSSDPTGPPAGTRRIHRGGGWHLSAADCRSANRYADVPQARGCDIGFRVVLVP